MISKANYWRATLAIAIPMMITQIINSMSGFLGNIMLSHLGHDVLAASAIMSSTQTMIALILMSILFSMGVLVAQAKGRGDTHEIGNLMQQGWILALVLSAIAFVVYCLIGPILILFGQDPKLVALTVPYFHWMMFGMPLLLLTVPCSQLLFSTGKQIFITGVMVVQAIILVIMADLLIFGRFGLPVMGPAGLGAAFVIATSVQFLIILIYLLKHHEFEHYHLFKTHMRNGWAHLKKLFSVGWPISVQMTSELVAYSFITYMIGWLGIIPLAASQIVTQFILLLVIPAYGFAAAAGILIGRAVGKKDYHAIAAAGRTNLILSLTLAVVGGLILIIFTVPLSHWFINPEQADYAATMALVKPLFIISVCTIFFDTIRNTLTGALRGLLDTRFPMWVGLLSLWIIRVPLAYFFGFTLGGGIIGIVWGGFIAMVIGAVMIIWRWRKHLQKLRNDSF